VERLREIIAAAEAVTAEYDAVAAT
jgi:hypothetical protein